MQNTRYYDIAHIEEQMARGVISRKKGQELIDRMYRQTKDDRIEEFRQRLIEKQKRDADLARKVRQEPGKLDGEQLKRAIDYFKNNPYDF